MLHYKKVVVVNAKFLTQKVTGVQRFAIEICRHLRKCDQTIEFVSPGNIIDTDLAKELGAKVIGKNVGSIWEQVDLRIYLLANKNPLLLNLCNTGMLFYKNQIVTIHDMSYKVNPAWFSNKFYRWYNFLIPHIAKNAQKIITVSNSSKKDITHYLKVHPDKINVVYNASYLKGIDNFAPDLTKSYILTVSSLDPRKNLNTLINAFKKIGTDVELVIVGLKSKNFGAGVNEELLNESIIVKGYVWDDELVSLIKNARAFVYISLYEGFGLPPIEAMGLGCPVIVSDIAAHREVCGDGAIYADPYDADDVKNKIIRVLNNENLKQDLIKAGDLNFKRFNWEDSAKKVSSIINECN